MTLEDIRRLAARAVEMTDAEQAEAVVLASSSALTRFANNRIHQNVAEDDTQVSVRAVLGRKQGVASTNRLDDESLAAACRAAVEAARHAPEDPEFPGLPGPEPLLLPDRVSPAARVFGPEQRAEAAHAMIAQSSKRGLTAAGTVQMSDSVVAVANSLGVDAAMPVTEVSATVLSMGAGGSGWASYTGAGPEGLDAAAMGAKAAGTAERSAGAGDVDPGAYTVLLSAEAVADLLKSLAYQGFSAKAVAEGSSFMSGRFGERMMKPTVTIADDALSPESLGLTFDFEGQPKKRTVMVKRGVAAKPVTDSYWAARMKTDDTGHALPAPNPFGPFPLNLEMAPGDSTEESMLSSVARGIYVTRFHYVNVEDPVKVVLTGMTRDGTFLIEDGKLTRALKNLRFTQGAVEAMDRVGAIGSERTLFSEDGMIVLAPALLVDGFNFTGQTA